MAVPQVLDPTDPAVLRSTQGLIAYLRDMVRAARKPVRNVDQYTWTWWLSELPEGVKLVGPGEDGVLLALDFEPKLPPPELPAVLVDWVEVDVTDPLATPELTAEGPAEVWVHGEDGELTLTTGTVPREEAQEVHSAYEAWLAQWRGWAAVERLARPRRELRAGLARIAAQLNLNDDTLELVLAVGLLAWRSPKGDEVRRHLVTIRAGITIDRHTSRLTVALLGDAVPQLEDRYFLDRDEGFAPEEIAAVREELATSEAAVLSQEMIDLLHRWLSRALGHQGRFLQGWERPHEAAQVAQLAFAPALIVRERDRNRLVEYYDRIHAALSRPDAQSPLGLAQLLFPLKAKERLAWRTWSHRSADQILGGDPLFPLAVNKAQEAVFERLRHDTAVVVQGPPGTGKTHTIANLLAALLADGKRVLVTSAKDQALEVLLDKEMLPSQLRGLCVRLANQRGRGHEELERTITALSDGAAMRNTEQLRSGINDVGRQRGELRSRLSRLREEVWQLREGETRDCGEVAPGYEGTRAAIARRVQRGRVRYGWIGTLPAPSSSSEPPLKVAEALELCRLLRAETPDQPNRLSQVPPDITALPTPERFVELVTAARQAAPGGLGGGLADALGDLADHDRAELERHLTAAATALHRMGMPQRAGAWPSGDWRAAALRDLLARRNQALWRSVSVATGEAQRHRDVLLEGGRHDDVADVQGGQAAAMAARLIGVRDHLASGGRLKRIRIFQHPSQRAADDILRSCWIDGRQPETAEEVDALIVILQATAAFRSVSERWAQLGVEVPEQGSLLARLEALCDRAADLEHLTVVGEAHTRIDNLLVARNIRHLIRTPESWDALVDSMQAARSIAAGKRAKKILTALHGSLARSPAPAGGGEPAPEVAVVREAIRTHNPRAYAQALPQLKRACVQQAQQRQRQELLERVRQAHPVLADQLDHTRHQPSWDQRLAELDKAWAWARAAAFLTEADQPDRDQALERELDETENALQRVTAQLAAEQAWLHCLTRMTQKQRQALQAFKNRMSDLGKGTSRRYAGRYRRAVREAMDLAHAAVPAWIMPLDLVVETIPPSRPDSFDVVIVDEASQLRVDAAFLLWLAPHVIVVGDDKQCSPPATSYGELQPVFDRLDEYLPDVSLPFRDDFSPKSNLYRLLEARFPQVQRLTDHYRCMPEIISWSSDRFYDNSLVPLRQYGADRLKPLHVVHIEDGYTDGRDSKIHNPNEAKRIIEKLKELFADPAYDGKTFGIIVLQGGQGGGQVLLLQKMIGEELPDLAEREERRLRVGSPEEFQGDQRDVILLSMVISERRPALAGRETQQRWNVAATRARDQMWLFTSVPSHLLSTNDLRYSLLTHMQAPLPLETTPAKLENLSPGALQDPFESLFEQEVFLKIRERGYHVIPQVPAGNDKRIDLVVVGTHTRLGVECDGHHWHRTDEQVRSDIRRERELRRAGWQFWRLREGDFLLDPDRALEPLWSELTHRGIQPHATSAP